MVLLVPARRKAATLSELFQVILCSFIVSLARNERWGEIKNYSGLDTKVREPCAVTQDNVCASAGVG